MCHFLRKDQCVGSLPLRRDLILFSIANTDFACFMLILIFLRHSAIFRTYWWFDPMGPLAFKMVSASSVSDSFPIHYIWTRIRLIIIPSTMSYNIWECNVCKTSTNTYLYTVLLLHLQRKKSHRRLAYASDPKKWRISLVMRDYKS